MNNGSGLYKARWQYQPTLTDHADIINVLTINDPASVVVTPGTAALVITAFPPTVFASDNKVDKASVATSSEDCAAEFRRWFIFPHCRPAACVGSARRMSVCGQ